MTEGEKALLKCGFELDASQHIDSTYDSIWYRCENLYIEFMKWSNSNQWTASSYYSDDDLPANLDVNDIKAIALRLDELNAEVSKNDTR